MTTIIEVSYVGPDDYDDIVSWLRIGSVMCSDASAMLGGEGGFISKGMLLAADRIEELEEELRQCHDRARD